MFTKSIPRIATAKRTVCSVCFVVASYFLWAVPLLAQGGGLPQDWQSQVRARVGGGELDAALGIVQARLREAPADLEALGWRARIYAWTHRWTEAEADYRAVLAASPQDTDILIGLADVLAWQQHWEEALGLLERASRADAARVDALLREGRALRALGRHSESRQTFREVLKLDPNNAAARAALAPTPEPKREFIHELRIGTDTDVFNFTDNAYAGAISLRSRWTDSWTTYFGGTFQHRFDEDARKFSGAVTRRLGRRDALSAGGAVARDFGVIPRAEAFLEYTHGFSWSRQGLFRGAELSYRQQWLWFREARVLAATTGVYFYFPRNWTWSVAVTEARSRFPGTPAEWRPSGVTRLGIPVHRQLTLEPFFAVGTENFAQRDQVGRFSARTWGGAMRWRISPRQEITAYVARQDRSLGREQISFGWSYAYRF